MDAAAAKEIVNLPHAHLDTGRHPITSPAYIERCRASLQADGALILAGLVHGETVAEVVRQSLPAEATAFHANSTHNVFLTDPDPELAADHPFNRQVVSSKGLIADDQVPAHSPLRAIYNDEDLRAFLCGVLNVDAVHPYADDLSSINVHFAAAGKELGWHFDNSSFAVTLLLQAPTGGGRFEYVPSVRTAEQAEAYAWIDAILDGTAEVKTLDFKPGDLVLFRGRDALHRVTPTEGEVTRLLVVFAYNDRPGVALSESALSTFYGRTADGVKARRDRGPER